GVRAPDRGFPTRLVVAVRERASEVEVRRFAQIAVGADVPDVGEIGSLRGLEDRRLSREDLASQFEEGAVVGEEPRDGNAGIGETILSTEQILGHERAVRE